jgi:hypothetical protein
LAFAQTCDNGKLAVQWDTAILTAFTTQMSALIDSAAERCQWLAVGELIEVVDQFSQTTKLTEAQKAPVLAPIHATSIRWQAQLAPVIAYLHDPRLAALLREAKLLRAVDQGNDVSLEQLKKSAGAICSPTGDVFACERLRARFNGAKSTAQLNQMSLERTSGEIAELRRSYRIAERPGCAGGPVDSPVQPTRQQENVVSSAPTVAPASGGRLQFKIFSASSDVPTVSQNQLLQSFAQSRGKLQACFGGVGTYTVSFSILGGKLSVGSGFSGPSTAQINDDQARCIVAVARTFPVKLNETQAIQLTLDYGQQ